MSVFIAAFNKAIADELQFKLTQRRSTISPNAQQQEIMVWACTQKGNLNIIARAGTGKSTTLLELARTIDTQCYASTFHSLGLKLWRGLGYRSEIDGHKTKLLAREEFRYDKKLAGLLAETVSFAKQAAFGVSGSVGGTEEDWHNIIDYYGIDDEINQVSEERFIKACAKVYRRSLEQCTAGRESVIDFDDMLLAPLYFSTGKPSPIQYDWVFVDEAQDSNQSRRMLARFVLKPQGRLVACGDDRQAIYHFAGASSDAMGIIQRENESHTLPLNVTYRCPKKIVDMACQWVPDYTAHESAPEGEVRTVHHSDFWLEKFRTDGRDVILCRNTRPLVGIAVRLREQGIACVVEGQSGQAIVNLITKWGEMPIADFLLRMAVWQEEEVKKWENKKRPDKVEIVTERCGTIRMLAAKVGGDQSIRKLVARVEMLFGDDNRTDVLRLCSVHRSKGREWERVFLVGRNEYMPSRYAQTAEELQQEENLMYVAITRVKQELVEVVVPKKLNAEDPDWWEV